MPTTVVTVENVDSGSDGCSRVGSSREILHDPCDLKAKFANASARPPTTHQREMDSRSGFEPTEEAGRERFPAWFESGISLPEVNRYSPTVN